MRNSKQPKGNTSHSHAKSLPKRKVNWYALLSCISLSVLVGLFSWGYFTITDPLTFPVNTVKIIGQYDKVNKQELKDVIGPYVSNSFFQVDVAALKQQIDLVPWVANSMVEKVWPDKVVVKFIEYHPVGRWNEKGLFTAKKEIFYPPKHSLFSYSPQLNGPEGYFEDVLQSYMEMAQALRQLGLKITELTLEPRHAWRLRLNNGMELILGKNDYKERLKRFIRVYPNALSSRSEEVDYVDLRYASGMAVRWKTLVRDVGV
jgi:cell division protein FtsQ